jgi:hypothetical protein
MRLKGIRQQIPTVVFLITFPLPSASTARLQPKLGQTAGGCRDEPAIGDYGMISNFASPSGREHGRASAQMLVIAAPPR